MAREITEEMAKRATERRARETMARATGQMTEKTTERATERILEVRGLSLGYEGNKVLRRIDFELNAGDFLCLVGANGSGKTTLVRGLLGLLKPMAGKIYYLNGLKQNFIGYMPQDAKIDGNFPASVNEIVLSGRLNRRGLRPFYNRADRLAAEKSLRTLGIASLKNEPFGKLSGGQKQKVLLARSLVATNMLLVLDEPSNNLDYTSKQELYATVKKLNQERGITVIMITHDLDTKSMIGNKVLSLGEKSPKVVEMADFVGGKNLRETRGMDFGKEQNRKVKKEAGFDREKMSDEKGVGRA